MNIEHHISVDNQESIKLVVDASFGHQKMFEDEIVTLVIKFSALLSFGGFTTKSTVVYTWPISIDINYVFNAGGVVFNWSDYYLYEGSLATFIRLLSRLKIGRVNRIVIEGGYKYLAVDTVVHSIEADLKKLPQRLSTIPFEVELCPSSSWINIECYLSSGYPPEASIGFNEAVWAWAGVANLGGFQISYDQTTDDVKAEFGVGIDDVVAGDDFIEVHCLMTGVPLDSLNCLVNTIVAFSRRFNFITGLYIG